MGIPETFIIRYVVVRSASSRRREHALRRVLVGGRYEGAGNDSLGLLHSSSHERNQGGADPGAVLGDTNPDALGSLLAYAINYANNLVPTHDLELAGGFGIQLHG